MYFMLSGFHGSVSLNLTLYDSTFGAPRRREYPNDATVIVVLEPEE